MLDFNLDMTWLVFFALFGMMSLTICVAALIAKTLDRILEIWDRYQYAKDIAGLYRK
jgi:hypothetical protein